MGSVRNRASTYSGAIGQLGRRPRRYVRNASAATVPTLQGAGTREEGSVAVAGGARSSRATRRSGERCQRRVAFSDAYRPIGLSLLDGWGTLTCPAALALSKRHLGASTTFWVPAPRSRGRCGPVARSACPARRHGSWRPAEAERAPGTSPANAAGAPHGWFPNSLLPLQAGQHRLGCNQADHARVRVTIALLPSCSIPAGARPAGQRRASPPWHRTARLYKGRHNAPG